MSARVIAVAAKATHSVGKTPALSIRLVAGFGVEGDTHGGATVQHRSRVKKDPTQLNVRQVHLIATETHDELRARGFDLAPGEMGENVTTRGIDLFALPERARLRLGAAAVVEVTGLRNPCVQLDGLRPGLMAATLSRDAGGELVRRVGVMAVVLAGGDVVPGDEITVELPPTPYRALTPV